MSRTTARTAALALTAILTAAGCASGSTPGTALAPRDAGLAAPARPAAVVAGDPVLVAVGDIACDPLDPSFNRGLGTKTACQQAAVAARAQAQDPDVVAVLGDMQYEESTTSKIAASFDKSWGPLRSIMRPAIGNHEYRASSGAPYWAYHGSRAGEVGKGWYSYELGSWHVIALNSNCTVVSCAAGSAQEKWLRADLAAHPKRCTLAYWHHARWSSGEHGDNSPVQPLVQALYDARADVVLGAHDHHYERMVKARADGSKSAADGFRSFVVGSGGKNHYALSPTPDPRSAFRDASHFGVLRLQLGNEAAGGDYTWKFVGAGGTVRDEGVGACRA